MDQIKQLYLEITSECNLSCVMCSRNFWKNESTGHMDFEMFENVIDRLPKSVERVFFGGVGEPLFHPNVIDMIKKVKSTGRTCELITNGTLLDKTMSQSIIDAGLDILWVSLDSMDETGYEEIRRGADYSSTISNIHNFHNIMLYNESRRMIDDEPLPSMGLDFTPELDTGTTELGISFVMMQSNLPQVRRLIHSAPLLGVSHVKITHLLPYEAKMMDEVCYTKVLHSRLHGSKNEMKLFVDMPVMDTVDIPMDDINEAFSRSSVKYSIMGEYVTRKEDYCRFVQEGVAFVRWDGEVCPCMAMLHDNSVYQLDTKREIRHCSFGNVNDADLVDIWTGLEYSSFRQRVIDFTFAPCSNCGTCDMFEDNETDCVGSDFPTCGGCLWAQGLIQCP